MDHPLSRS
jgi:TBC1 domain family member 13